MMQSGRPKHAESGPASVRKTARTHVRTCVGERLINVRDDDWEPKKLQVQEVGGWMDFGGKL